MHIQKNGCRAFREEAGLSRERLAHAASCSASSIAQVEHGRRCSEELAARIAGVLGCGPEELFQVVTFEVRR